MKNWHACGLDSFNIWSSPAPILSSMSPSLPIFLCLFGRLAFFMLAHAAVHVLAFSLAVGEALEEQNLLHSCFLFIANMPCHAKPMLLASILLYPLPSQWQCVFFSSLSSLIPPRLFPFPSLFFSPSSLSLLPLSRLPVCIVGMTVDFSVY